MFPPDELDGYRHAQHAFQLRRRVDPVQAGRDDERELLPPHLVGLPGGDAGFQRAKVLLGFPSASVNTCRQRSLLVDFTPSISSNAALNVAS